MSADGKRPATEQLSPAQFARLKELFALASEQPEPEREELLASLGDEDAELARALARMLADDRPETVLGELEVAMHSAAKALAEGQTERLERTSSGGGGPPARSSSGAAPDLLGQQIGPYRLLEVLGEGGMGVVYRAERSGSFRRQVALKLVKAGMDSQQVLARFESERQALALMEHPNISVLHDGGTSEDGHPYFVMELVKGEPLNRYCDLYRLDLEERLRLFLEVCDGVQHAHQKGVIHRDLKPSNVLVSVHEGKPVPKIIDFGIAKAMAQPLTDESLYTALGSWIGTPEYMSPEQAGVSGLDVDTRGDVYSLGVILYELLVGVVPFSFRGERGLGLVEIRRSIWEDEAARPSTRAAELGEEAETVARNRRLDPKGHVRRLRGDLGWITLRCLEKDRNRRYGSPADLAADIRRYLADQPVLAGPPSVSYRARKFVRRHRLAVAAALFVVTSLALAVVGVSLALVRAQRAETVARQEAATAERVITLLVDLFSGADPEQARGETITAREILDRGAQSVSEQLGDEPFIQARLQNIIATVYQGLGLYDDAAPLLQSALENQRRDPQANQVEVAIAAHGLASVLHDREEYETAEPLYRESLEILERELGPSHEYVGIASNNLAMMLRAAGMLEEAEPLYRQALSIQRANSGGESSDLASGLNNLALLLIDRGSYQEAEELIEESLAMTRKLLGDDHPNVATSLLNIGMARAKGGDLATAERLFREGLAERRRVLGDEHPEVGTALNNLGGVLFRQGRFEEAEDHFRRARSIWITSFGEDSLARALVDFGLAGIAHLRGNTQRAEELFRDGLTIRRRLLGEEHSQVAQSLHALAIFLHQKGELEESESLHREALALRRRVLEADHPEIAESAFELASVLIDREDPIAAAELLAEAERLLRSAAGRERELMRCLMVRAELLIADRRFAEAEAPLTAALKLAQRILGEEHWQISAIGLLEAERQAGLGRPALAQKTLTASRDALVRSLGKSSPYVVEAEELLAELHRRP